MFKLRIGTRQSQLAVWQAQQVAQQLQMIGCETELVLKKTKGDRIQDVAISKIGSKGVFTEELEMDLREGKIDLAVHSAKDLQSRLPSGFQVIAFLKREKANDVVVSNNTIDLNDPNLVLGTSSTRRVALFRHFYPELRTVDVRGNLQTRLDKMNAGLCDALVLAYAGVYRMGYTHLIQAELPLDQFIPAVGQGSIAVEAHSSLDEQKMEVVRMALNDPITEKQLLAERTYLAILNGGCSIPVFALATFVDNQITLEGGIISLDGKKMIRHSITGSNPEEIGHLLGELVLREGGDKILNEIRKQL